MGEVSRPACPVLAVIGAAILLAVTVGCGAAKPVPPPGLNEVQTAGWQVYTDLDCAICHGEMREGKRAGPPLIGLATHWSVDRLVSYLNDPDEMVRTDPRLAYRAEKYTIGMPKVSGKSPGYADKVDAEKLALLAEYLLADIHSPDG